MTSVTALEAKTRFGKLLERVARGEEIIITRHEKPVARLVPARSHSISDIHLAVTAVRDVRARIARRLGPGEKLTNAQIKDLIAQGRR